MTDTDTGIRIGTSLVAALNDVHTGHSRGCACIRLTGINLTVHPSWVILCGSLHRSLLLCVDNSSDLQLWPLLLDHICTSCCCCCSITCTICLIPRPKDYCYGLSANSTWWCHLCWVSVKVLIRLHFCWRGTCKPAHNLRQLAQSLHSINRKP